jgi:glucan phosphoethanolaminetransferase (alkaline phosphatase superfamily)
MQIIFLFLIGFVPFYRRNSPYTIKNSIKLYDTLYPSDKNITIINYKKQRFNKKKLNKNITKIIKFRKPRKIYDPNLQIKFEDLINE